MGRLTLNVLLSFAQFEREVTGERIRDKIAASKRKGMWMGGVPPLGLGSPAPRDFNFIRYLLTKLPTYNGFQKLRGNMWGNIGKVGFDP